MSIISWIILGLVSGFIASKIVSGSGKGFIVNLVLGVVGAFVGGFAFTYLGHTGLTGLNFWSLFVAVVGSLLVLVAYHAVARRS
jgi:uncharacterized membrane protein YeaQ/YmgE (transglycosylase-associated protein family)